MKGRGLLAVAVAAIAVGFAAPQALAATIYVNDDAVPAVPAGCAAPASPTIQGGVNLAAPGDTVFVCRGTYTENVGVPKTLLVRGQIIAPDLTSCDATRSAVTAQGRVTLNGQFALFANDIEIRNFRIQNNASAAGIYTSPLYSGYVIFQNLIQDNVFGIHLNSSGGSLSTVSTNCLRDNNTAGGASGNAVYSDQGFSKGLIQANRFFNHANGGISFHVLPVADLTVQGNIGSDQSSFFEARAGGTNIDIAGNIHRRAAIRDVLFNGSVTNSKIRGNIFKDSSEYGLQFRSNFAGVSNSNLTIEGNIVDKTASTAFQAETNGLDNSLVKGNIGKSIGTFAPHEPFCAPAGSCGLLLRGGNLGNTFVGNIFHGTGWGCRVPAPSGVAGNTWTGNIGKPMNTAGTCT